MALQSPPALEDETILTVDHAGNRRWKESFPAPVSQLNLR